MLKLCSITEMAINCKTVQWRIPARKAGARSNGAAKAEGAGALFANVQSLSNPGKTGRYARRGAI